jgi:hypothetical protein
MTRVFGICLSFKDRFLSPNPDVRFATLSSVQVRLMIGYSTWHVTTRKNVVKEAPGVHAMPPHSPSTFRYSPSSVRLTDD